MTKGTTSKKDRWWKNILVFQPSEDGGPPEITTSWFRSTIADVRAIDLGVKQGWVHYDGPRTLRFVCANGEAIYDIVGFEKDDPEEHVAEAVFRDKPLLKLKLKKARRQREEKARPVE